VAQQVERREMKLEKKLIQNVVKWGKGDSYNTISVRVWNLGTAQSCLKADWSCRNEIYVSGYNLCDYEQVEQFDTNPILKF
jgi:hypothetical protein